MERWSQAILHELLKEVLNTNMNRDIFISYSRKDLALVKSIKSEIEKFVDTECWMDLNGIESGAEVFIDDIVHGIEQCRVFLFMLSEHSQASEYAMKELKFAYDEARLSKDKHVVIININGCQMTSRFRFMYGLADIKDWRNEPQHDKLMRDLKTWTSTIKSGTVFIKEKKRTFWVNGVSFNMIYVEGGMFTMGVTKENDSEAEDNEMPVHKVTLSCFYIGETVVTQALWNAVMGMKQTLDDEWNIIFGLGDKRPAYNISYNDCQEFLIKLNQLTGCTFRLPTEAEWEYAARGGSMSKGYKYSGSNTICDVAWFAPISNCETHDVGEKQANELGLYDMSGNVFEWCHDAFEDYTSEDIVNPRSEGNRYSFRVSRGGSYCCHENVCRSTYRSKNVPWYSDSDTGLRLAL